MKIREFAPGERLLGDPGRHSLPAEPGQGRQAPLGHGRSSQFRRGLDQRHPMGSGRSLVTRNDSFPCQPFPCQMAGSNDYNFGKTGGKGFNRLE